MNYLRSDSLLSEILEEKKSLSGFLDTIFGFLSRRTDFYHVQKSKDEKSGFPRGIKEEILMSCMQKYENDHETHSPLQPPPAIEEVEIETDSCEPTLEPTNDVEMPETSNGLEMYKNTAEIGVFSENDYKNGAMQDTYCWTQTLTDIELSVMLPEAVKSGKHVKLDLKSNYISIKSLIPKEQNLVSGETWKRYKYNDVVWTIADGRLNLSFDKSSDSWWDKLFVHEESIDVKQLDTDRPIDEYSDETQRVIEKIQTEEMTNNDLKTLPISKSEQLSRLKQAWNAENSPFKGQPFDSSVLQFN